MENLGQLIKEAARIVVKEKYCEVSLIQRRMSLGYSKAFKIVVELEKMKIVDDWDNVMKQRNVLVSSEAELEKILLEYSGN